MRLSTLPYLCLALCLGIAKTAAAQNAAAHPFAMSSGGGVSLGAYQAGQLYYQALFNHENRAYLDPKIMTGVSAGAINAFLGVISKCQGVNPQPDQSYYWKMWSDVNFARLKADDDKTPRNSLFSNRALFEITEQLRQPWQRGWEKGCDITLGIPVTMRTPEEVSLGDGLEVPRQTLFFVLKISGQGYGVPPRVQNEAYSSLTYSVPRLYLATTKPDHFDEVINLILASGAFPGAFPAKKVRVCISNTTSCEAGEARDIDFVDGGIYENQPIRLAFEIARLKYPGVRFSYRHVDADGRSYPEMESGQARAEGSFVDEQFQLLSDLVSTSRKRSLYALVTEHPEIKDQIMPTNSRFPRASEPWGAFFGFFDRGFREFDFLLGMYESRRDSHERVVQRRAAGSKLPIAFPKAPAGMLARGEASWGRLECMTAYLDGVPEAKRSVFCNSDETRNLRILAQMSLWRLHGYCRAAQTSRVWQACTRVSGPELPLLSAEFAGKFATFDASLLEEGALIIEKLELLGYRFDQREYHADAPIVFQIRHKIQQAMLQLASVQPADERDGLKAVTIAGLDMLVYAPAYRYFYLGLGELSEIGLLLPMTSQDRPNWMKWNLALETYRISEFTQGDGGAATLTPLLGLTVDVGTISDRRHQFQVGLAVGTMISASTLRGADGCEREHVLRRNVMCDGGLARAQVTYSLLNMFRATLALRVNFLDKDRATKWDIIPMLGFGREF